MRPHLGYTIARYCLIALLSLAAAAPALAGGRRVIFTRADRSTVRVEILAVHDSDLIVTKMVDPSEQEIDRNPDSLFVLPLAGMRNAVLAGHGNFMTGSGIGVLAGMLVGAKLAVNAEGGGSLFSDENAIRAEGGALLGVIPGALVGAMIGAAVITGEEELDLANPQHRQLLCEQARFRSEKEPPAIRTLKGRPQQQPPGHHMKIKLSSVFVDNQEKALKFYTEVLGFIKKSDVPAGEYRWLTVVSPDGPNDLELVLEPNANPAAKTFQKALLDQGIPATAFFVDDVQKEYERLSAAGVVFTQTPVKAGPVTIAIFNDTCGNLIQLVQP